MRKPIGADSFIHHIDFLPLAANATGSGNFQIDGDSDFRLHKLAMFADIAAAGETEATRVLPLVTVLLKDSKSGRNLMVDPVPIAALFGDGRLPFVLPRQKVFPAQCVVTAVVQSFDPANAYNLRLVFIGEKLFYE
jgi:hypothetical protein